MELTDLVHASGSQEAVNASGRNPDTLQVTAIVDPRDGSLTVDDLKRYRDAGATRIVVYSQKTRQEDADGKGLEVVKRLAPIVERAQQV